jgi:putative transposase
MEKADKADTAGKHSRCFDQHAVWLYLRFTLSYRNIEDLLAERGIDISCETIRRWVLKFGPSI